MSKIFFKSSDKKPDDKKNEPITEETAVSADQGVQMALFPDEKPHFAAEEPPPEDAFDYALDLWYEYVDATFSIAYREAMKHKEPHAKAWNFAKFCSETDINQHWAFIGVRDLGDFPEMWQREIIAEFKIKDAGKGWPNYVNEIRQSLGLEPQ